VSKQNSLSTLGEILELELTFAREAIAKGGGVPNHFTGASPSGLVQIVTPWSSTRERTMLLTMVRKLFTKSHVRRFAHVSEAWAAEADGPVPACSPSQNPARVETLMIGGTDLDTGERQTKIYKIFVLEGGSRQLADEPFLQEGIDAPCLAILDEPRKLDS
jgi:hypothetical protein